MNNLRPLNSEDLLFLEKVVIDIDHYLTNRKSDTSILLFPPLNNWRRFLIHHIVSDSYTKHSLTTLSVGTGAARRICLCNIALVKEESPPETPQQASLPSNTTPENQFKKPAAMFETEMSSSISYPSPSPKKTMAAIYTPPHLRKNNPSAAHEIYVPPRMRNVTQQQSTLKKTDGGETKTNTAVEKSSVKLIRAKRPDQQVYVPRALRSANRSPSTTLSTSISPSRKTLQASTVHQLPENETSLPSNNHDRRKSENIFHQDQPMEFDERSTFEKCDKFNSSTPRNNNKTSCEFQPNNVYQSQSVPRNYQTAQQSDLVNNKIDLVQTSLNLSDSSCDLLTNKTSFANLNNTFKQSFQTNAKNEFSSCQNKPILNENKLSHEQYNNLSNSQASTSFYSVQVEQNGIANEFLEHKLHKDFNQVENSALAIEKFEKVPPNISTEVDNERNFIMNKTNENMGINCSHVVEDTENMLVDHDMKVDIKDDCDKTLQDIDMIANNSSQLIQETSHNVPEITEISQSTFNKEDTSSRDEHLNEIPNKIRVIENDCNRLNKPIHEDIDIGQTSKDTRRIDDQLVNRVEHERPNTDHLNLHEMSSEIIEPINVKCGNQINMEVEMKINNQSVEIIETQNIEPLGDNHTQIIDSIVENKHTDSHTEKIDISKEVVADFVSLDKNVQIHVTSPNEIETEVDYLNKEAINSIDIKICDSGDSAETSIFGLKDSIVSNELISVEITQEIENVTKSENSPIQIEKQSSSAKSSVISEKKDSPTKSSVVNDMKRSPHKPKTEVLDLNPDECDWESLYDDDGECLVPGIMNELIDKMGQVSVEKPSSDYKEFQSVEERTCDGESILEIYDFSASLTTRDLMEVFVAYHRNFFDIKWVDDTHALGVFCSPLVADEVLNTNLPNVKTRPLKEGIPASKSKARYLNLINTPMPRPKTCIASARRLVQGALGIKVEVSASKREAERKLLRDAREKKRQDAKLREEIWGKD